LPCVCLANQRHDGQIVLVCIDKLAPCECRFKLAVVRGF